MNKQKGFELIELMVVVAIIAILAAIAIPSYLDFAEEARIAKAEVTQPAPAALTPLLAYEKHVIRLKKEYAAALAEVKTLKAELATRQSLAVKLQQTQDDLEAAIAIAQKLEEQRIQAQATADKYEEALRKISQAGADS